MAFECNKTSELDQKFNLFWKASIFNCQFLLSWKGGSSANLLQKCESKSVPDLTLPAQEGWALTLLHITQNWPLWPSKAPRISISYTNYGSFGISGAVVSLQLKACEIQLLQLIPGTWSRHCLTFYSYTPILLFPVHR